MDPSRSLITEISSGGWNSVGPFGNGIFAVVLSIMWYFGNEDETRKLDNFIKAYQADTKIKIKFATNLVTNIVTRYTSISAKMVRTLLSLLPPAYKKKFIGSNRAMTWFCDGMGKVRYIAIADWITQTTLSSYHHLQISVLKMLKTDYTFDQLRSLKTAILWYELGLKHIYSFDLSAATDRIPIRLQSVVLQELGSSKDLTDAWEKIMIDTPFTLPNGIIVKYAVGQGIGIYSSWSAMALTHHALVLYSAYKVGKTPFKHYIILGDDVVIADPDVALAYKDTLYIIGLEIRITKSVISTPNTPFSLEFASKWVVDGINVSPLPLGLVIRNRLIDSLAFVKAVHKSWVELALFTQYGCVYRELLLGKPLVGRVVTYMAGLPLTGGAKLSSLEHILSKDWVINTWAGKALKVDNFLVLYGWWILISEVFLDKVHSTRGGQFQSPGLYSPGWISLDPLMRSLIERVPLEVLENLKVKEFEILRNRVRRLSVLLDKYWLSNHYFLRHWQKQLGVSQRLIDFLKDVDNFGLLTWIVQPWVTVATKIYKKILVYVNDNVLKFQDLIINFTYHKRYKVSDLLKDDRYILGLDDELIESIILLAQGPLSWFKVESNNLDKGHLKELTKSGSLTLDSLWKTESLIKSLRASGALKINLRKAVPKSRGLRIKIRTKRTK